MYRAIRISIGLMVAIMMLLGLSRLLNGDGSGKPSEAQLLAELTRLRPSLAASEFRYVNKLTAVYVTADTSGSRDKALAIDPSMAGWILKKRKRYPGGERLDYCRGRLALVLDTTATAGTTSATAGTTGIGIYWVSDRESSFYCAR